VVEQYDITLKDGFGGAKRRSGRQKKDSDTTWYYLGLVGQIGYVVALPIAGGAILGSFLGHKVLGIGMGFLVSVVGFVRVIQKILSIQK
jgi:hypothetical protein